ncbi:hypothetical protein IQ07DRAFT_540709 [Pyrenochaeta sp. DS3sAY3a]|nr:hypothetical protein IQ07DRAFT_540709 [Pyrenochaeta sp. DS3sAY3a]
MASAAVGMKRSYDAMSESSIVSNVLADSTTVPVHGPTSGTSTPRSRYENITVDGISSLVSSTRTTPRNTPAITSPPQDFHRKFTPNASIVLIGMRGTGKSTLAVIASIACRRRVVDIDHLFQEATGFSAARYRKQFGAANHNLRQEELLQTALRIHDKGAILVCNGGSLERNGQALMQDFARTHPVIHVVRDLHSVHDYLGGIALPRLQDMLAFSAPILRRCSNYEFFNISEARSMDSDTPVDQPATPAFLTLKRAQRTFLKFLSLITSYESLDGTKSASIPPLEPGYPLSDVATELRQYTCAVQVPIMDLLTEGIDVQGLEIGSDAFEVCIDPTQQQLTTDVMDDISNCISKIRRNTVVPIIYHVYPSSITGASKPSYMDNIQHGLRMAPEFATIDLSLDSETLAGVLSSRGITKIIGHLHADVPWDSPSWLAHYKAAVSLGCAVVRFTRPADSIDDDIFIQILKSRIIARGSTIPLICYNTGRAGRRSVCFNKHLTPVIPESMAGKLGDITGVEYNKQASWLTAREVSQALYSSCTFDPMQISIIGATLEYSVSPAMQNAAYRSCGMPHEFIRVQSSSLNSLKELVRKPNFGGSIVIQPFKIEVISLADSLSQHARAIGAVNTLIPVRHLKNDGSIPSDLELFQERNQSGPVQALYGDNTEWIGIRSCVRRGLSPANAVRPTTSGLIIGAGGMARAAVYTLLQLGVQNIVIFNRTVARAENLVAHFTRLISSSKATSGISSNLRQDSQANFVIQKSRDDSWPEDVRQPTIILSCIPDTPAAQFTLPSGWMRSPTGGVIMEISYKTLNTPLMQQVHIEGGGLWTYLDGLDFLPEQAFAQFELFTGKRAPRRVMREEVLRAWRDGQGNPDPEMVERRLRAIDDQEP